MSFDFETLITDRTAKDVSMVREITQKIKAGTASNEELEGFNSAAMKGAYNYTDLNRVNAAMDEINRIFTEAGYAAKYQSCGKAWDKTGIPTAPDMKQYLDNLESLRSTLNVLSKTPETPAGMSFLTWEKANAIEQILLNISVVLKRLSLWIRHSNAPDFYAGTYGLPTSNPFNGRNWEELDALNLTWDDWDNSTFFRLVYGAF